MAEIKDVDQTSSEQVEMDTTESEKTRMDISHLYPKLKAFLESDIGKSDLHFVPAENPDYHSLGAVLNFHHYFVKLHPRWNDEFPEKQYTHLAKRIFMYHGCPWDKLNDDDALNSALQRMRRFDAAQVVRSFIRNAKFTFISYKKGKYEVGLDIEGEATEFKGTGTTVPQAEYNLARQLLASEEHSADYVSWVKNGRRSRKHGPQDPDLGADTKKLFRFMGNINHARNSQIFRAQFTEEDGQNTCEMKFVRTGNDINEASQKAIDAVKHLCVRSKQLEDGGFRRGRGRGGMRGRGGRFRGRGAGPFRGQKRRAESTNASTNPISMINTLGQTKNLNPTWTIATEGSHFSCEAKFGSITAKATASNKKEAKTLAAQALLPKIVQS